MTHLVLIHGWGIGAYAWAPLREALALCAPHCRIRCLDLPGYGCAAPDGDSFIGRTQKMLDALPAGCTLCAWSLGALHALQAARLAPQRISHLVLAGATPCFMQREGWSQAQPPALLDAFMAAVNEQPEATLQRFIALLNQGDTQSKAIGRQLRQGLQSNVLPAPGSLHQGLLDLRDVDLRQTVSAIQTPVLLIHGEHDPLMPLAAAQWLAVKLSEAQLQIISGAAHAAFLTDPVDFAARIVAFCNADCHAPAGH